MPAERIGRTGRFSGRVALGVLLVLVAVIGGAVLLRRADASEPVLVAAHDLSSGVRIQEGDLRVVRVRMPEAQLSAYARPGPGVVGSYLIAGVRKDGLLAVAMLAPDDRGANLVDYPIPVETADVPDLRPGDRVAVVVSFDDGPRRGQAPSCWRRSRWSGSCEATRPLVPATGSRRSRCGSPRTGWPSWPGRLPAAG